MDFEHNIAQPSGGDEMTKRTSRDKFNGASRLPWWLLSAMMLVGALAGCLAANSCLDMSRRLMFGGWRPDDVLVCMAARSSMLMVLIGFGTVKFMSRAMVDTSDKGVLLGCVAGLIKLGVAMFVGLKIGFLTGVAVCTWTLSRNPLLFPAIVLLVTFVAIPVLWWLTGKLQDAVAFASSIRRVAVLSVTALFVVVSIILVDALLMRTASSRGGTRDEEEDGHEYRLEFDEPWIENA